MATRYTGNQTRKIRRYINTWRRGKERERGGEDRVEENIEVWKARWTNIRRGRWVLGKRRKTAEESTRSTAESVHGTPINNDTSDFTKDDGFLCGRKKGRREGEREWVHRVNQGVVSVETEHGMKGEMSKGFLGPLRQSHTCDQDFPSVGLFSVPVVASNTHFTNSWSR